VEIKGRKRVACEAEGECGTGEMCGGVQRTRLGLRGVQEKKRLAEKGEQNQREKSSKSSEKMKTQNSSHAQNETSWRENIKNKTLRGDRPTGAGGAGNRKGEKTKGPPGGASQKCDGQKTMKKERGTTDNIGERKPERANKDMGVKPLERIQQGGGSSLENIKNSTKQ